MRQFEIPCVERMLKEVLDGFLLSLDTLFLVVFVKSINAEPRRNRSGIDINIVYEERSAERKNLNDDQIL